MMPLGHASSSSQNEAGENLFLFIDSHKSSKLLFGIFGMSTIQVILGLRRFAHGPGESDMFCNSSHKRQNIEACNLIVCVYQITTK